MSRETGTTRRVFQLAVIYGLWGVISAALAIPAAIYLLVPPRLRRPTEWFDAGEAANFSTSDPEEVVFRRNRVDGWKVSIEKTSAWVVKNGEELVAFAPGCTHLGCAYHWDERNKNFLCPCHTSTFGLDGKVLTGPAPRALDRYHIKIENGKLLIGDPQPPTAT